jgi:hypothetical protein
LTVGEVGGGGVLPNCCWNNVKNSRTKIFCPVLAAKSGTRGGGGRKGGSRKRKIRTQSSVVSVFSNVEKSLDINFFCTGRRDWKRPLLYVVVVPPILRGDCFM